MTRSALELDLHACEVCGKVASRVRREQACCPRCGSTLHTRKPYSISRTWCLLLAAVALYLPANLLPVMSLYELGRESSDTIMGGVIYFLLHGDWPLALIIFVASIVVPLLKMLALAYLLVSVQLGTTFLRRQRTQLYRVTELMGRWSMVDVFVIALLTGLVQSGRFASVEPELGAVAFCAVVILTMLAAMTFDPRLIWDRAAR